MDFNRPNFPSDLPNWQEVKTLLNDLKDKCLLKVYNAEDIARHVQHIYETNHAFIDVETSDLESLNQSLPSLRQSRTISAIDQSLLLWFGVIKFLARATEEENNRFLFSTFPAICDLVLQSEYLIPQDLSFSEQQKCSTTVLSRRCVASILACSFMCLFPERKRMRSSKLNVINFTNFFRHLPLSSQNAKMRCILNYFERVTDTGQVLKGHITYSRQVIGGDILPTMADVLSSDVSLCSMFIHTVGVIEDIQCDGIEVDFANRSIGGGVLGRGRVQEEIRFSTCPELMAAMLFMENMDDNEAIIVSGYEQFSRHSGYASGLEYVGDYRDPAELDEHGNFKSMLCAIDATQFKGRKHLQYLDSYVLRELNKAVVGFCDMWPCDSDTSSHSAMSSHGLNSSTDDDFHTAYGSSTEEDGGPRYLSSFVAGLLSGATHQAPKTSADKHKFEEELSPLNQSADANRPADQSKSSGYQSHSSILERNQSDLNQSDPNQLLDAIANQSQSEANQSESRSSASENGSPCDRNHYQVNRTLATHPQNGSNDLLDVDYGDWLSNFRRRSSNLSDVSRRSSSSTKHSSDLSSDLEEFYDSYLKNEKKKHGTIEEETSQPGIADFATKLISCLMQEGTSTAAQMMPGMQMFDNVCPSDDIMKPCAMRLNLSFDDDVDETSASVSKNEEEISSQDVASILQNYAQTVLDATLPTAFQEVAHLALTCPHPAHPAHQDLPTDRMYEWFADQIVQQVILLVSQEFSHDEEQPAQGLSQDPLNQAAAPSAQAADSTDNPPSSVDISVAYTSSQVTQSRGPAEVRFADERPSEGFLSDSESCSYAGMAPFVIKSAVRRRSSEGCVSEGLLSDGGNSESAIGMENAETVNYDTRTSTPNPDFEGAGASSSIPAKTEQTAVKDFKVKLDYHEAAAIIVDHVLQSLPTHLMSLATTNNGNHRRDAGNHSLSAQGSFKGLSDTLSSLSDKELRGNNADGPVKLSRAGLPNVGMLTKKLSREMLTNAFLNSENRRHIKSYERRSSEPCHISVQLSLQAYNSSRLNSRDEDTQRNIAQNEDDLGYVRCESFRRGSWSSFPTSRRRSSCGFRDHVLSKFAEELIKADTSVPPLFFFGAQASTSTTTGSRRSSLSCFKDQNLAKLENELLNSSLGTLSSPRNSIRSSGSRKGCNKVKYEGAETESWFPLPKKVGTECQEELFRSGYYHSVDEIEDFADMFANDILNQAVSIIYRDAYLATEREELASSEHLQTYAGDVATSVISQALGVLQEMSDEARANSSRTNQHDSSGDPCDYTDAMDIPFVLVDAYADTISERLLKEALELLQKHTRCKNHLRSHGLPISTGNWGCGAFGGDPQLKSMLQWIAASLVQCPGLHYYTFNDGRMTQFDEIVAVIQSLGWTVGHLMTEVRNYCNMISEEQLRNRDPDSYPSITLFEYLVSNIYM